MIYVFAAAALVSAFALGMVAEGRIWAKYLREVRREHAADLTRLNNAWQARVDHWFRGMPAPGDREAA